MYDDVSFRLFLKRGYRGLGDINVMILLQKFHGRSASVDSETKATIGRIMVTVCIPWNNHCTEWKVRQLMILSGSLIAISIFGV